jgi:hypothetical protein
MLLAVAAAGGVARRLRVAAGLGGLGGAHEFCLLFVFEHAHCRGQ